MKKHKHIPFGNGHITWYGKDEPTKEQYEAFQKMHDIVLNLDFVSNNEAEQHPYKQAFDKMFDTTLNSELLGRNSEVAVSCSSCKWMHAKFTYKCCSCFHFSKWEQDTDC